MKLILTCKKIKYESRQSIYEKSPGIDQGYKSEISKTEKSHRK